MTRRLLYILFLALLAVACTSELTETKIDNHGREGKVVIDFSVHLPDITPSTKALSEKPDLKNLMVAVFDQERYLVEYTFAYDGTVYANENGKSYIYKVALTQSTEPRIIHFIGNAPENLRFGTEETVLSYVRSELRSANEDLYWYRRAVPSISGTNQTVEPIYQATPETIAAFDNIPLIRNFARIRLVNGATDDFELESWTVVNTYKTGTCAAYNTSNGTFVEYFNYTDSADPKLKELGIKELGTAKNLDTLILENYRGNVPANCEKVTVAEAKGLMSSDPYYYAYERDVTSDPAYIIVRGIYKGDGKNNTCFYKIGLYDNNGNSFPLLRNFQYTLTMTKVERAGYESFEVAAASTGSGNISTAQETSSLVYISDGDASLSVDYTEKMIVEPGKEVDLGFKFISDVNEGTEGSLENVRVVVNKPEGVAGAAIAKINNTPVTAGQEIRGLTSKTIKVLPVDPSSVTKKQSLTIYADYEKGEQTLTLQRTVTYIVWEKQALLVECIPSEIPQERGSELDVQITLPGGLSSSMFPLDLKIEAEQLSITPNTEKDHMPVQSGKSIINTAKSAFYFIKTVLWEEYRASKLVTCHFKSNKAVSDSKVYVANNYFVTANDEFETFVASHFTIEQITPDPASCVAEVPVSFKFTMDGELVPVTVYLGGLAPAEDDTNGLTTDGTVINGKGVYTFTPKSKSVTLKLQTTDADSELYVGLEAYHYIHAEETAARQWAEFTGNFSGSLSETAGDDVSYTFNIPSSGYYKDMVVKVKLDGLQFASTPDSKWTSKGNGVYEYRPTAAGNVTMNLLSTTGGKRTDYVTLSAPGFRTLVSEINQSALPLINEFDVKFLWNHGNDESLNDFKVSDFTITISKGTIQIGNVSATRTGSSNNYTYTVTMKNVSVQGADSNSTITISYVRKGGGNTTYTYKASTTVSELSNSKTITITQQ